MTFKFKYKTRKQWFWSTFAVLGFQYDRQLDKLALDLSDGGMFEIPKWSECYCKLGSDYKKYLETLPKPEQPGG
ncbi:MAG: hypothetical protein ACOH5I_21840 [Oligoflexus sp.]